MKSICILRFSAIGDVTHVVPVVLSLQEQIPGVQITWVIGSTEAKLVGDLPGVEFIIFDKKQGLSSYRHLWNALKGRHFDAFLHMQLALRANLAAALVRADLRVGYDQARSKELHGLFVNRRIPAAQYQHVLDCLGSFPVALGLEPARPRWHIPLGAEDRAFADQFIDSTRMNLVISPSASHELRNWPVERYAALADYAVQHYGARIILTGSPSNEERDFCRSIETTMDMPVLNLCGRDTLKQLAALLAKADLLIAPDTGPTHIANAMGTDVLGLFAGSNPYRSGPYNSLEWCVNCYPEALERFTGKRVENARWGAKAEFSGAMSLITVADATEMLKRWMARKRHRT